MSCCKASRKQHSKLTPLESANNGIDIDPRYNGQRWPRGCHNRGHSRCKCSYISSRFLSTNACSMILLLNVHSPTDCEQWPGWFSCTYVLISHAGDYKATDQGTWCLREWLRREYVLNRFDIRHRRAEYI